jgi:hypothetical protein
MIGGGTGFGLPATATAGGSVSGSFSLGGASLTSSGAGGILKARSGKGRIGVSNVISGGSSMYVCAMGASDMRLPQRARTRLTPSVMTASPLASFSLFLVQ